MHILNMNSISFLVILKKGGKRGYLENYAFSGKNVFLIFPDLYIQSFPKVSNLLIGHPV